MHQALPVGRLRLELAAWMLEDGDVTPLSPGATADVFLVESGADRYVAKIAYQDRRDFEPGLHVAELLSATLPAARPLRTLHGEILRMVEWPPHHRHPLVVMPHLPGMPLDTDRDAGASIVGGVCGQVHALLATVAPSAVASVANNGAYLAYLDRTDEDLGAFGWLHATNADLARAARQATASRPGVRWTIGVWDGPDILIDGGDIGLIDFGNVEWAPLVHFVANRSLIVSHAPDQRLGQFLAAVQAHLPLTAEELSVLPLFRRLNAAIYAKYAAWKLQRASSHGESLETTKARLQYLASYVERTDRD